MKVHDIIKLIEHHGWRLDRTRGSHRQFRHPSMPGTVTIAGHPKDDLSKDTIRSILKQAGLTRQDLP
jgi:predicted RNA binding protein YcfA (HicA-like mRNA interferase family)